MDPHTRKHHYAQGLIHPVIRDLIRDAVRPTFGFGGVVSDILFWLTNVRNLLTTKGSGPAVFDRGDSSVTVNTYGGLETTPINVIGSPGMRISYDTDEGATENEVWVDPASFLGAGWSDDGDGSYTSSGSSFSHIALNVLTVGSTYEITFEYEAGATGTVRARAGSTTGTVRSTPGIYTETLVANGNSANVQGVASFVGGIRAISFKNITPAFLNTVSKADATLLTPVTVVEGADVYINVNKWVDATLYAAGSYATDFDGVQNKYYLTALGGTSNGTGVADDIGVTDWVEQGNYVNTNDLPGIASNPAFTQYFVLPEAPVTQTISLGTGNFTLFVWGSDGASVAANTATGTGFGAATLNTPITINITGAGTVDVTVTGTPLFVGLHNTEFTAVSVLNPTTTVAVAASTETSPQVFSTQFIRCRATGGLYAETLYSDGTNILAWDGTDLTFTDGVATLTAAAVVLVPNDDIVVDTTDGKLYVNGVLKDTDGTLAVTWGTLTIIGNVSDLAESSSFDPTDQDWKTL